MRAPSSRPVQGQSWFGRAAVVPALAAVTVLFAAFAFGPGFGPASALARTSAARERVIVLLRAHFGGALTSAHANRERVARVLAAEAPLLAQLRAAHATGIERYRLVDGLAATVSAAERRRLAADPAVAAVIPDATISLGSAGSLGSAAPPHMRRALSQSSVSYPSINTIPQACSATESAPFLDPEGLQLTGVDSTDPNAPTARKLGFTGAGVKVGWIADGVDPNNENLIRQDGTSVFSPASGGDYQDFSGDGPGQPTSGAQAFIDSNTIAGQGLIPYDVENFGAQSDPTPCWIRIEGVAPGASLVGLDAVGSFEDTTTSNFLQAIDYAVETDHVNVLDESFGSTNFPDLATRDAIKQFNDAAVAAGVFVTVQSGNGGPFNTITSPATDPSVMSVGASTDLRFYAQTNDALARYFATGWSDNQISSLSSSGFDQAGATVDLVAPGDLSFASCDPSSQFAGCVNFLGQPSNVEEAGGTGEASAFVAGAAALVIQAYRLAHNTATPSPALIKQILTSTASDVTAPAQEQGAGLLNVYQAVQLASSLPGAGVTPPPVGSTLLLSSSQLDAVGPPGTPERFTVQVTNAGSATQTVNLSGRTFGPEQNIQTGTVQLTDSSPQYETAGGVEDNVQTFQFNVQPGSNRLVGALSWPVNAAFCQTGGCATGLNSRVRMILIDPSGELAADSIPQGSGSYGTVEVDNPQPGTWQGVIFGATSADGGTTGTVSWQVGTELAQPFGLIVPSTLVIPAGQTQSFTLWTQASTSPGDRAGAVVVQSSGGSTTTIPVALRSMIDVPAGGQFSGTLTGGNGQPPGAGQEQFYEFHVPLGTSDIAANLQLTNDSQDPVAEYLVSPDGDVVGYGQNSSVTSSGQQPSTALSAYAANPEPGCWTLVVAFAEPTAGDELSQPYTGQILFGSVRAGSLLLPKTVLARLPAGQAKPAYVFIRNTSAAIQDYFVDPRLNQSQTLTLAPLGSANPALPLTGPLPTWVVPSETSSVSVTSTASVPAMLDAQPITGDPDVASAALGPGSLCSLQSTVSYAALAGFVTPGIWEAAPAECGPYSTSAPPATDTLSMSVVTKPFDTTITSSTGDGWIGAVNPGSTFTPLVLGPGQAGTINVMITPSGAPGTRVSGTLYVDTLENDVPPFSYAQSTGDELAALPYAYTVGAGG